MRVAIILCLTELVIKVNPAGELTREGSSNIIMPWMYAPWPEAKEKGIIEIELEGETLRDLLAGLSDRYRLAKVDFEPVNLRTKELEFDYDVVLNGQNYADLPHGLETNMTKGDELRIRISWRWDG